MRNLLLGFILLVPSRVLALMYNSSCTINENPVSQGGRWLNGATDATNWVNIKASSGVLVGLDAPVQYSDPTAVLKGAWGLDQDASAIAFCASPDDSQFQEVEIHLRTVLSAGYARGIECLWRCSASAAGYAGIVWWNGALADFLQIGGNYNGAANSVVDGDVIRCSAIGPTITMYKNGTILGTATDPWYVFYTSNTWGGPGVGTNYHADPAVKHGDFGVKSFTATDAMGIKSSVTNPGVQFQGGYILK